MARSVRRPDFAELETSDRAVRERLLRVREAEQKALAELGPRALTHASPAEPIDQAVGAVSSALGVEIVAVDALLADGDLLVRAAVGLTAERRFTPAAVLVAHGARGSASVVIGTPERPWGVLIAAHRTRADHRR